MTLERANPIAHVARRVFEPWHPSLIAQRVHRLRRTSGLDPRETDRRVGIVTVLTRVFGHQLEMQPQLISKVLVPAIRRVTVAGFESQNWTCVKSRKPSGTGSTSAGRRPARSAGGTRWYDEKRFA